MRQKTGLVSFEEKRKKKKKKTNTHLEFTHTRTHMSSWPSSKRFTRVTRVARNPLPPSTQCRFLCIAGRPPYRRKANTNKETKQEEVVPGSALHGPRHLPAPGCVSSPTERPSQGRRGEPPFARPQSGVGEESNRRPPPHHEGERRCERGPSGGTPSSAAVPSPFQALPSRWGRRRVIPLAPPQIVRQAPNASRNHKGEFKLRCFVLVYFELERPFNQSCKLASGVFKPR